MVVIERRDNQLDLLILLDGYYFGIKVILLGNDDNFSGILANSGLCA